MKALSIKQPWASLIACGIKTIETRTWSTNHRGDLLIVASKKPRVGLLPIGVSVCLVNVKDCRPMMPEDAKAACAPCYEGAFAWVLTNVRPVKPFPISGRTFLYDVDLPSI